MKSTILPFLLAILIGTSAKWKLKYIEKGIPISIEIKGRTSDDSISLLLKDTLNKMGLVLISPEQRRELVRQYFANLKENMKTIYVPPSANYIREFKRATEEIMERGLPASQSLFIEYAPNNEPTINFDTCDSIGFVYTKYPSNLTSPQKRFMWSIKQIGSRSADSIFWFLTKKI